ncbi:MAG TPA: hypothetical protein VLG28_05660 [Acidimicrobiia bacterium]|jgi:hypothetical protein|nr:hypothetical protein [Acidimicrobiia bacterium]
MLFATHYQLTGERSRERVSELMAIFGQRGAASGTLHHFVYADGGGGIVIGDESGSAL